ncbi:MAG: hypothetical protein ACKOXO_12480 [Cyanobium sp.]
MTTLFSLILLPLRAPLLLLLLLISVYLGLHWSRPITETDAGVEALTTLVWSAECLQALVVVVVCTIPELLLQRLSSVMAASRVASLVVSLLLVITGGLYLLHLEVLSNVLILASAVLLARLDLVRLRVVVAPLVMTLILSVLVLGGVSLGRSIEASVRPLLHPVPPRSAAHRRQSLEPAAVRRAPALAPATGAAAAEPARTDLSPDQPRRRPASGAEGSPRSAADAETPGLADPVPSEENSEASESSGEQQN